MCLIVMKVMAMQKKSMLQKNGIYFLKAKVCFFFILELNVAWTCSSQVSMWFTKKKKKKAAQRLQENNYRMKP